MATVHRADSFHIDAHRVAGDRLAVDGYLSRTGIQEYLDSAGNVRREYRPPEEVFSPDALASLRGMPVTIGHPPQNHVDSSTWRMVARGHTGDDPRRADDGVHTVATVWVLDSEAQEKIRTRQLSELSIGYSVELVEQPGVTASGERYDAVQTNIRGNHLALLPAGMARGGAGCRLRLDGANNILHHPTEDREERGMKISVRADGKDFVVEADDDSLLIAIAKDRADADALRAKLDAAEAKIIDLDTKLVHATAPETISAAAEAIIALRADARLVAGGEVSSSGRIEICKEALSRAGVDVDGKDDTYISARFDAELDLAKKDKKRTDGLSVARGASQPTTTVAAVLDLDDVFSRRLAAGR